MKFRFASILFTALALTAGWLVLLSYPLGGILPILDDVRGWLTGWASLLAATAVIIGVLNLMSVHLNKIAAQSPGWLYSSFLVIGCLVALTAGIAPPLLGWGNATTNTAALFLFRHIILTSGTALAGLIAFILVLAGYRLLHRRLTVMHTVFIFTAIVALLGMLPAIAGFDLGLRGAWVWLAQVPAVAGARGLLIGVALGITATGLRILLAADRPYGE